MKELKQPMNSAQLYEVKEVYKDQIAMEVSPLLK